MGQANNSRITVAGQSDNDLAVDMQQRVQAKIAKGDFTWDNEQYVKKASFAPVANGISINSKRLEQLRRLCQLWDVKLRPREITSHRKFTGPIIVAVKKIIFPILQAFFKDTLHQQRSFNAAAIELIAELCEENEKLNSNLTHKH